MSKYIFTNESLQILRQRSIEHDKNRREAIREEKINDIAGMFMRYILCVNSEGHKKYTCYIYNYDEHFVTDIVNIIRETFPDNTIIINWNLFYYTSVTVYWK